MSFEDKNKKEIEEDSEPEYDLPDPELLRDKRLEFLGKHFY